ncbi:hypothetical protein EUGRSUZ_B02692 [Eucalyptus grandis]|uniref:Uncharacterized protein n=2 Tax=Eucalyptus grandis TaxID=71139 RepID=A0ACC3LU63_EUCGR|nr:hypothetical protein EUGRSUZ_B02692 [Eucalyptus grandis]
MLHRASSLQVQVRIASMKEVGIQANRGEWETHPFISTSIHPHIHDCSGILPRKRMLRSRQITSNQL